MVVEVESRIIQLTCANFLSFFFGVENYCSKSLKILKALSEPYHKHLNQNNQTPIDS